MLDSTINEYVVKPSLVDSAADTDPQIQQSASVNSLLAATNIVQTCYSPSASRPSAAVRTCTPIVAHHLILILCIVEELILKDGASPNVLSSVCVALTAVTLASAVTHAAITRIVDSLPAKSTMLSLLQVHPFAPHRVAQLLSLP